LETALARIAALAATLKEAELRTLLELTRRANADAQCRLSSRQLAEAAGISRKNAQLAIDSLSERGLITSDGGSATRAATYKLQFLRTEVLTVRGVVATPPTCENNEENSAQVALFQRHPGAVTTPPLASEERHPWRQSDATANNERARAGADPIDAFDLEKALDRLRRAKPSMYDPSQFAEAKAWMHGYMAKFGELPNPHPPDDAIAAQFLAISEWPRLLGMMRDLMDERKKPHKYGWFVVVAMQRMWGLTPQQQRKARERLQLVKQQARDETGQLRSAIAAAAAGKGMR